MRLTRATRTARSDPVTEISSRPVSVDLQVAWRRGRVPAPGKLRGWISAALDGRRAGAEVSVRVVGEEEACELNRDYRSQDKPTNVLAFPSDLPAGLGMELLGDLVLCGPLVEKEAIEQRKDLEAHWAHLVVHGTLHLVGLDHQTEAEAREMEALEVEILAELGYPDPYDL